MATRITRRPPMFLCREMYRYMPFGFHIRRGEWKLLADGTYHGTAMIVRDPLGRFRGIVDEDTGRWVAACPVYERMGVRGILRLAWWLVFGRRAP